MLKFLYDLYGTHMGPIWASCPDSAHMGPICPCVLGCDQLAWFSIFDTAKLTDLGSKTGYHRLRSFKMSNNLLINHDGS